METKPGNYLKAVRERLQLCNRNVQEASAVIAREQGNKRFYIAASRLAQIENEESIPSPFKMFSLCAIYGLNFHDVLRKYGVNANQVHSYTTRFLPGTTRLTAADVYGFSDKVSVPVRLDPSFSWETTQLINRVVGLWGEIPASFLLNINPRRYGYGYMGLADKTMFPLIRPGSLMMIDPDRRRVTNEAYKDELDRPIYFVELRQGYRCAWCQVEGSRLTLVSHPTSGVPVQTFNLTKDADVVGQVVWVAMRLVPPNTPSSERVPRPPEQREVEK